MANTSSAFAPRDVALIEPNVRAQRSLFRRLFDAMIASRQRQAEREIARYLQSIGEKFTDDAEREIERRFLSGY
jgi:uncharacterized protein YecA (UPF0149 family)